MREKHVIYRGDTLPPPTEYEEGDLFLEYPAQILWLRLGGAWVMIASASILIGVQNVGAGTGQIFRNITSNIANLRTLRAAGGLIEITTGADEVDIHGAVLADDPAGTGSSLLGQNTPPNPYTVFLRTIRSGVGAIRMSSDPGNIIIDGPEFNNVGTGAGVYRDTTAGNQVNLRTLVSGDGSIAITENQSEIDLRTDLAAAGGVTNGANVGTGAGEVFRNKTGTILNFRRIADGGGAVDVATVGDNVVITGAEGQNLGTVGARVFENRVGNNLRFRRLVAGQNITITEGVSDITIASAGAVVPNITDRREVLFSQNYAGNTLQNVNITVTSQPLPAFQVPLAADDFVLIKAWLEIDIVPNDTAGQSITNFSVMTQLEDSSVNYIYHKRLPNYSGTPNQIVVGTINFTNGHIIVPGDGVMFQAITATAMNVYGSWIRARHDTTAPSGESITYSIQFTTPNSIYDFDVTVVLKTRVTIL